jgi:hypothetical protein
MHEPSDRLPVGPFLPPRDLPTKMIDREKVLAILSKRFPSASSEQLAAAANAIVGLREEWREIETRVVDGRCLKVFEQIEQ